MEQGNIPVLMIQGKTLPEVWERSLLETWEKGMAIKTQYDKPGDPPSRDVSIVMVIEEPFAEPRIHKCFPGGLENLEIYRQEVVEGCHDYWIKPEEGKWTYTYHQRLFGYIPSWRAENKDVKPFACITKEGQPFGFAPMNQIQFLIDSLAKSPYSRRSQGITYMPSYDQGTEDPPCLQRVWCRMGYGEKPCSYCMGMGAVSDDGSDMTCPECHGSGKVQGDLVLNMNTHWRSRDAYKAAFMNMYALMDLQRYIAEEISKKLGKPVRIGRYTDVCDSYHIYGSYFKDFEGFLETCKNRTFESRVWRSDEEVVQGSFADGKAIMEREKATGQIGMAR